MDSDTGELLTRATACVAFACYATSLALRMSGRGHLARVFWTAGAVVFLLHVACAFQFVHHWSHSDAYASTARQTAALTGRSSGAGLYLNYAMLVIWPVHACWDWRKRSTPGSSRSFHGIESAVQGFLAFMWLNATVVFGHGPAQWLGAAAFAVLVVFWVRQRSARSKNGG